MSESDLRDANLRADKLQAQRDAAVALLYEAKDALYDLMEATGVSEHPTWSRVNAFLETL